MAILRDNTATGSENRANSGTAMFRALFKLLFLAVATGNLKHAGTVSGCASHNTKTDPDRAGFSLRAFGRTINVSIITIQPTIATIITTVADTAASRVAVITVVIAREFEGYRRVNHGHQ